MIFPDATHLPACKWTYSEDWRCFVYRIGHAYVTLGKRQEYCDRGRWDAKVFGIDDIDWQDGFPRYYMSERRAKLELVSWLRWRLLRRSLRDSRIVKTRKK